MAGLVGFTRPFTRPVANCVFTRVMPPIQKKHLVTHDKYSKTLLSFMCQVVTHEHSPKTGDRCVTQLAKMSIDPNLVHLTADVAVTLI